MVRITGEGEYIQFIKLNGKVLTSDSDPDELFTAIEAMARIISDIRKKEFERHVKSGSSKICD